MEPLPPSVIQERRRRAIPCTPAPGNPAIHFAKFLDRSGTPLPGNVLQERKIMEGSTTPAPCNPTGREIFNLSNKEVDNTLSVKMPVAKRHHFCWWLLMAPKKEIDPTMGSLHVLCSDMARDASILCGGLLRCCHTPVPSSGVKTCTL